MILMEEFVCLDHAAATKVDDEVLREMLPFLSYNYGNASSLYSIGRISREAVEKARAQVADVIGCSSKEVYFTSCGSESDNLAIKGLAKANSKYGRHIMF